MVDGLHVDEVSVVEVHSDSRTEELLDEHRHIEAIGVEASDVTAFDPAVEATSYLGEGRAVCYVGIGDTVYSCRLLRYGHLGVDAPCLRLLLAVGMHLEDRDLDDTVTSDLYARRL